MSDQIKLEPSWKERVGDYLQRDDMQALAGFLRERKARAALESAGAVPTSS